MKPIQVLFDERLLQRLDADEEVQRLGRSEVMRRAVAEYLRSRRARRTAEAYQKAYGAAVSREGDLTGWADEGAWPE